jgi:hexokinase
MRSTFQACAKSGRGTGEELGRIMGGADLFRGERAPSLLLCTQAVIVDRKGHVRKIHTGFSGPATGEHYKKFVDEFKSNLEQLLGETAGGA